MSDRLAPLALLIVAATVLVYLPALQADFVWDDNDWVTENPLVTGEASFVELWTGVERLHYYPVTFTAWRLMHALWELHPFGYHLVNVLLHALNALLVVLLLRRLDVPGAACVGLLFALHPVHVESVAWVTELKNVLSAALLLGSAYLLVRGRRRLALAIFVLAVLSKTVVAVAAPLFPWLLVRATSTRWKPAWWAATPFIAVGTLLGLLAVRLEAALAAQDQALTFVERLQLCGSAIGFYAQKLIVPHPLSFHYERWPLSETLAWHTLLAVGVITIAVIMRYRDRLPTLGWVASGLLLAPALGWIDVYWFRYAWVAEHFVYLASIPALALVVAAAARWLPRTVQIPLAVVVLGLFGFLSWQRAHDWKDTDTLWRATLKTNPTSWLANHSLAIEALDKQRWSAARTAFERALEGNPDAYESRTGLAMALLGEGDANAAVRQLDAALEAQPSYPQARLQRGIARSRAQQFGGAIEDLTLFLNANPQSAEARIHRARAAVANGSWQLARDDARSLQQLPDYRGLALEIEGLVLLRTESRDAGCSLLEQACASGACRIWQLECAP